MILILQIISFLLHVLSISSYWHLYNEGKIIDESCPYRDRFWKDRKSRDVLTEAEVKKWKLWPLISNTKDIDRHGELLYGFNEAMDLIWKNQHPPDCRKAKFLIAQGWLQGFGSEVHIIGLGLAFAMRMNRVYMMNPDGPGFNDFRDNRWQVNNSYCKEQGNMKTLECYYEPWTHCSFEDAMKGRTVDELRSKKDITYYSDTTIREKNLWELTEKTILLENRGDSADSLVVPTVFENMLRCSPMDTHFYYYWWRAISAAYLLRPNAYTLEKLNYYRSQNDLSRKDHCVGMYVRRGDKHVETSHTPIEKYLYGAKFLWDQGLVTGRLHNLEQMRPVLVIGSEDQDVINAAIEWGKQFNWKVICTTLFDRRSVSAGFNFSAQEDMKKSNEMKTHDLEYFSMLLNLDYILRCDAYVCTTTSNFCRVIEELRATVASKANKHYLDVSQGCSNKGICLNTNFYLGT